MRARRVRWGVGELVALEWRREVKPERRRMRREMEVEGRLKVEGIVGLGVR